MESKTIDNGNILQNPASVLRYQYDNHLGSACLELSDNGDIINYEEYYPFGQTSYYTSSTNIEISLKRYKYCGKEKDEETGLYYYGMRYYADWLCRFVSVDPLQFEYPELTSFQYASNNPVTMIDLDGAEGVKPETLEFPPVVNEVDPKGGLGEKHNGIRPLQLSSEQKTDSSEIIEESFVSYKKDIVDGELQSDDITQQRIKDIEQGSLNSVKGIVLHRTASSTTQSVINAFKNGRNGVHYGTHFVVGKDGKILQTAHLDQKTFHVGKTRLSTDPNNSNSIGIEVVGNYDKTSKTWEELTPEQIEATSNLVNYLLETFDLSTVRMCMRTK